MKSEMLVFGESGKLEFLPRLVCSSWLSPTILLNQSHTRIGYWRVTLLCLCHWYIRSGNVLKKQLLVFWRRFLEFALLCLHMVTTKTKGIRMTPHGWTSVVTRRKYVILLRMSLLHVDMTVMNAMSLFYSRLDCTGFLYATMSSCIGFHSTSC